ncbi:MAG: peptidase M15 [Firmicutes bacterium HGW-Firmicutes-3]|jgi:LAS superfamily LD-carboxypeptidase LdcB|nr:MAG: peptidase M15 [Firmicutes bacterium HGW-Firmicutes-3]
MNKIWLISLILLIIMTGCGTRIILKAPVDDQTGATEEVNEDDYQGDTEYLDIEGALEDATDDTEKNENSESKSSSQEIVESDIVGYHDLIVDLSDKHLDVDITDPRLSDLIKHLKTNPYNHTLKQIGKVTEPDHLFALVNKLNQLPMSYIPVDLREPEIRFTFTGPDEKRNLRDVAASSLEAMFDAADAASVQLFALSGYRSYNRQRDIYNNNVSTRGVEATDKVSARPGHSEHQSGLAMDITSESAGFNLIYAFGETEEGIWVKENAHLYGFIVRYGKDKTPITGYDYEPWHLRYIGLDLASYIYDHQITLEELYIHVEKAIHLQ